MSDKNNNEVFPGDDDDMTVEIVTFEDEEGNSFSMEIVEEFTHKGLNYAVLTDFSEDGEDHDHAHGEGCNCGEDCDCEQSLYIFQIVQDEEGEEDFVAIEDDNLLEELSAVVESLLMVDDETEE